ERRTRRQRRSAAPKATAGCAHCGARRMAAAGEGGWATTRHARLLRRFLRRLPAEAADYEPQLMTVLPFAGGGLGLLRGGGGELTDDERAACVDYVYSLQAAGGGFVAAPGERASGVGHMAMPYAALLLLHHCGDDLRRVDRPALA